MRRVYFIGTPVDLMSVDETVATAGHAIKTRTPLRHVALNVAKFVKMRSDAELHRDVRESDVVGVDGMGIAWALRMFGAGRVERVSGVDLMLAMFSWCERHGYRPYVLGARADTLARAAAIAQARYPGLTFAGLRDGYFGPDEEAGVVAAIRDSGADCLFVAMPTPRKERFLHQHAPHLRVPFIMGVGGSVDVLAGKVSRAPLWMQWSGMEWLHRLLQEPRKMAWRYASTNTAFAGILLRAAVGRITGRRALSDQPPSR